MLFILPSVTDPTMLLGHPDSGAYLSTLLDILHRRRSDPITVHEQIRHWLCARSEVNNNIVTDISNRFRDYDTFNDNDKRTYI